MELNQSPSRLTDELVEKVYRQLMPDCQAKCPERRQIVKVCLNPECKTSLRCDLPKCRSCGDKTHKEYCSSLPIQQFTRLYSLKAKKWTDMLIGVLEKEEELIGRIRQGQSQFIGKFFDLQLKETQMESIRTLFSVRGLRPLSGQKSYDLLLKLQKELKVDMKEVEERNRQYSSALLPQVKEIESLRDNFFISKKVQISRAAPRTDAQEKNKPIIDKGNQQQNQEKINEEKEPKPQPHSSSIIDFEEAKKIFRQGNTHYQAKNYEKAIELYTKATELDPTYLSAHHELGCTFCNLKKYEQGIKCFRKVVEINPTHTIANNNMGYALNELGKYEEALLQLTKTIKIKEDYPMAYSNRAFSYRNLGRYEQAILDYHKSIALDITVRNSYEQLGIMLTQQYKKVDKLQESIKFLNNIPIKKFSLRASETLKLLQKQLSALQ